MVCQRQPVQPSGDFVPGSALFRGTFWPLAVAAGDRRHVRGVFPVRIFRLRPAARHVRRGSVMTNAIELTNVSKIYRRYTHRRQFATLKSALLSRSLVRDLSPDETFAAVRDLTVEVPCGRTL